MPQRQHAPQGGGRCQPREGAAQPGTTGRPCQPAAMHHGSRWCGFLGVPAPGRTTCNLPGGETTSAKASFHSRERKERAGRESELEPGAESYGPRAGARQQSWRSREGAIHKTLTVSRRAGQGRQQGQTLATMGLKQGTMVGSLWVSSRCRPRASAVYRGGFQVLEEDKGSGRCLQLSRVVWGSALPARAEGWMGSSACFPPHSPLLPAPSPSPWALRGWERVVALTWWPPAIPAEGEQASGKPRRLWGEGAAGPRGSIK